MFLNIMAHICHCPTENNVQYVERYSVSKEEEEEEEEEEIYI
jgi:hypothetical protein